MTNEKASVIIGNIPVYGDECYSIAEYQEAKTVAVQALLQEQKSGKWITEEISEGRKVYCSECKESAVFEYVRDGDIYSSYGHGVVKKTKYCPNCGAKMVEPQERNGEE